ncbi:ABC transporter ATP-binding protein [Labrys wisconsinensis]|uniref:Branched-chain amino acid transport system ATP-binding protein n=1 Tax=Labrys wisconsinensis TaxID=425677 RepID=A0ABU0JGS4_9HYPH|nr:ABC transporter ATP-binding protein [Labrys wisconsinensis]MDQ0473495.1 branched-chain amino acid transport system ATP-binding protein [Labrys wisconsinensis]
MSAAPLLQVRGLTKRYGGVTAVADVGFDLAAGELLAMVGPNGAGKTTCFNMLNGQLAPDGGTVRIAGIDTAGLPPRRIWQIGVGRTFQIAATFQSMTVSENVETALLSHAGRLGSVFGRAHAFRAEAEALLERVGLGPLAGRPAGILAYGDVKRLELALALASRPRLLLMDEPAAGMAPRERVALMRLVAQTARSGTIGVLFTEHDMDVVFENADRVMVLDRGRLIAEGSPAAVRSDPEVQAVYLGKGLTYEAGA